MNTNSTFYILLLFVALLIFNCHSTFGCGPRPTERSVDRSQSAILLIGDHQGIDETDVNSVAQLVAQELREQGIRVGDPVHETPASGTVYRIILRRSDEDEKILFRLSEEDTAGTLIIKREILLTDIEETVSAAPRLVYALVHREPIATSSFVVNAGVFTAIVPVKEVSAPGVGIGISIDELSYAVEMEGRFALMETGYRLTDHGDGGERKDYFHFYSVSIGGRYFFSKQNISPYIGGGFGIMSTKYETTVKTPGPTQGPLGEFLETLLSLGEGFWDYDIHSEEADGVGAYGVLGIEFRRFSRGRLKLELRVDRPFFTLPTQDVMPITLGIAGSLSF